MMIQKRGPMHPVQLWTCVVAVGWLSVAMLPQVCQAAEAHDDPAKALVTPQVFQAAGPAPKDADKKTITDAIQGTVDAFRAALGDPNNGNNPRAPRHWSPRDQLGRRRQHRRDDPPRSRRSTCSWTPGRPVYHPGHGPVAGSPAGGPQGGLAGLFDNPTYGTIFSAFSPLRLFTPVGSNLTRASSSSPAPTRRDPSSHGQWFRRGLHRRGRWAACSTQLEYFDVDGKLIFSGFVPASPGDGSLSFFGIVFHDARIAQVRITTGNVAPGPDDDEKMTSS